VEWIGKAVVILSAFCTLTLLYSAMGEAQLVGADPKTIVVPTDYSTIQAAVGNASAGDTVFVRTGTYYIDESTLIVIDETLSLVGENAKETILSGNFSIHSSSSTAAIRVAAPNVSITGLTIANSITGIAVVNWNGESFPSGCTITGNNILNNSEGIRSRASDLFVSENDISNNSVGISGYNTQNIVIAKNNLTSNGYAVNIGVCRNLTISQNNIEDNDQGLNLRWYGPYLIRANRIVGNGVGIHFAEGCCNATVTGNHIEENSVGVELMNFPNGGDVAISGTSNIVFSNNFVGNAKQAFAETTLEYANIQTGRNGTDIVFWDNGTVGNFWSDYSGIDLNGDGKGDTPYIIDGSNKDNHPLTQPIDSALPTNPASSPISAPTMSPDPSMEPTSSPSVSPSPTQASTAKPSPTSTNTQPEKPAPIVFIAGLVIAVVLVGLLVYFAKHKGEK
jgi:nitrous oxidase accessory protein NosD